MPNTKGNNRAESEQALKLEVSQTQNLNNSHPNPSIDIIGAREHNLKNLTLSIPRNSLIVFTGLSGSGKSSLAFDTIYAEGQRRYMESFSAYARQFIGEMKRPDVDKIDGLSPVISIEQVSWCGPAEPTFLRPQVESVAVSPESNLQQVFLDDLRELTLSFRGNSVVQSKDVLCTNQACNYFFEGQPLYADPAHLTSVGSLMLKPAIVEAIEKVVRQK